VIAALIAAVLATFAALELAGSPGCTCPCTAPAPSSHPFRRPGRAAFDLNRQGREHYRARRWEEARARYREALNADPTFLAPRLNIACAHAQQERFAEAVSEASELARAEFVPWAREIREAADLAPLHARPEMKVLRGQLEAAGRAWGASLQGALLFVARRAPAVNLPPRGVLYLGLEQEILGWLPASGMYRQVTAEEGRVLGFVQSVDGHIVVYVRAGRLVREPGRKPSLRALSLRKLDLVTMALGPEVPIRDDVVELHLELPAGDTSTRVVLDTGQSVTAHRFDGTSLLPVAAERTDPRSGGPALRLTAAGVVRGSRDARSAPCRFEARDVRPAGAPPAVRIQAHGRKPVLLDAAFGAGLRGLPFP
jgi:hypothetical protein